MRRQSLHNPVCICCLTNRSPDKKQLMCKSCHKFIYQTLNINREFVSKKLRLYVYCKEVKNKCSFCDNASSVSYKDYDNNRKYYICKTHLERWLKIGCQLGQLSNILNIDEE